MSFFNKNDFKMSRKGIVPVTAWNALVDLVFALSVQSVGSQMLMRRGVDGTSLSVKRVAGGVGAAEKKLIIKSGSDVDKFRVTAGRLNGLIPTLGGTALDDATTPEFTVTADTHVWIKCVGVFGSPDTYTVTIETDTAGSGYGDPPAGTAISGTGWTGYRYVGVVEFTGGTPDVYLIDNFYPEGGDLIGLSWGLYNQFYRN